jgi:hypothetical protein
MDTMTVRELIEHLAQYDQDMPVRVRDQNISTILYDLPENAIEVEQFIDTRGDATTKTTVLALG